MRKGLSANSVLVTLIIFAAFMIIAAVIYTRVLDAGKEEYTMTQCQASLLTTRSFQEGIVEKASLYCASVIDNPIPLTCNRRFLTIGDDEVRNDFLGVETTRFYDTDCDSDNCLAKNAIAEEMAYCWDLFFEGEVPVFQQLEDDFNRWISHNKHTRGCFICTEIRLETTEGVTGFREYLETTEYKEDITYYNFLAENRNAICNQDVEDKYGNCWDSFDQRWEKTWMESLTSFSWLRWNPEKAWPGLRQDTFATDSTYVVTFMRHGMEEACQQGGIGRDTPTMVVKVLPAHNISAYCDSVIA